MFYLLGYSNKRNKVQYKKYFYKKIKKDKSVFDKLFEEGQRRPLRIKNKCSHSIR
ncbi:hypothetical protein GCM10028791_04550 [Echinicola sediminis]